MFLTVYMPQSASENLPTSFKSFYFLLRAKEKPNNLFHEIFCYIYLVAERLEQLMKINPKSLKSCKVL